MQGRPYIIFLVLVILVATASFAVRNHTMPANERPVFIPPSEQRNGDSATGYTYLTTGDYLKSGIPYSYYLLMYGKDKHNYLNRTGKNANVQYGYNVVTTADGVDVVVPTCLQCHAQEFDGKLYMGLGNTFEDFSNISKQNNLLNNAGVKAMQAFSPKLYNAAKAALTSFDAVYAQMQTEVQGVNSADKLAALLVAHRDPQTLEWHDTASIRIPDEVIPTDVPAWWLLKKKNAMFYNGFGRGDFAQFLMMSNILTVKDSSEAREVNSHFGDVLAYIRSLNPPQYPYAINDTLATQGKIIFANSCSKCHGSYGDGGQYPNLLIPANIIQTDSSLFKANYQNPQLLDWFNQSWFAQGPHPARLEPYNGYIAPPLDGIWITAPYLHNGSVPTLEALLNSKERPRYWKRDFKHPEYDYDNVGWKYEVKDKPEKRTVYNTDLPGYHNTGHTFGDKLSDKDRKALIEYLKTL